MSLDRATILAATDTPREEVQIPEWGGSVWVKTMSGAERDAFEIGSNRSDMKNLRARMAVLSVVDADGKNLFSLLDVDLLGAKSAKALDRIWEVCTKLNKIMPADIEEMEKN